MQQVVLYRDHEEVISSEPFKKDATNLYEMIHAFFDRKKFPITDRSYHNGRVLVYDPETRIVVAHSLGTTVALEHIVEQKMPYLEKIVLLDPSEQDAHLINTLSIPYLVFVSTLLDRPYTENISQALVLKDGHFFPKSFDVIQENMGKFLSNKYALERS